jgi:redox-sensitive bicupin YhaK (pirin superfamily)
MPMNDAIERKIARVVHSVHTLEGGGFPVRRPFPTADLLDVDPFLLLDHLGPVAWGPGEGIGAPDHPHRGFETVTYLLEGEMQHTDSGGHSGSLRPGDVQWMTAGSGVVHSELPSPRFMQEGGTMHGFQIWVNLPAADKMIAPRYQEVPRDRIPEAHSGDGKVRVRIIAGESMGTGAVIDTHTPIVYLHFTLEPGGRITQSVPADHNGLVYVVRGEATLGSDGVRVREGQLAVLGEGDVVTLSIADDGETTDLLVLAGRPIGEPLSRYGPFVMNTDEQIREAIADYRAGRMGEIRH